MTSIPAVVLAIVIPALASADPAPPAPVSAPRFYAAGGFVGGLDSAMDWMYGGVSLDGGARFNRKWWVHARVDRVGRTGYGTGGSVTVTAPSDGATDVRIGPEARFCNSDDLCGYAGGDLGYRDGTARGRDISGMLFVVRGGLDVGNDVVRFRPGLEAFASHARGLDSDAPVPLFGLGATLAVAFIW